MRPFDVRLLRVLPAARRGVVILGLLGLLQGAAAIGQAVSLAGLVVAVVEGAALAGPAGWFLAVAAIRAATAAAIEVIAARTGARVSTQLRARLCEVWLGRSAEDRPHPDKGLTLAVQGTTSIEPYLARYLPTLIAAAIVPTAAVTAMVVLDWRSALVPVLTVPLLPLFAALIGASTAQATAARWHTLTRLSGHFRDVMRGLPTLVGYGRAEPQAETIREVSHRHRRASVATLRLAFLSSAALELLATLSVAIVAVFVGIRLAGGSMPLEVALPVILLAPEAYWPIRRVGAEFHAAADGADALRRVLDDLAGSTGPGERPGHLPGGPVAELDGVGYRFPSQEAGARDWVLTGVTAALPAGLTVVTGPSGAGKTTLLELLAGQRQPDAGILRTPPAHLVGQRPFLAPRTIRENLLLGAPVAVTDRHLATALDEVGLTGVANALPDGLDTRLGDDGFGLSAGQRARLACARALISDADLLLFDEPTAHLDPDTARTLARVIVAQAQRRPVVVVTHGTDLLEHADLVLRLNPVGIPTADDRPTLARVEPDRPAPNRHPTEPAVPNHPAEAAVPNHRAEAAVPSHRTAQDPAVGSERLPALGRPVAGVRGAAALGTLALSCGVALTATSGWLVVAASFRPPILTLLTAIVLVRAFGVFRPVLRYAERIRSHDAALAFLAEQRALTYRRLIPLSPARLGRRSRGDVLSAVVDDLDDLASAQVRVLVPSLAMAGTAILATAAAGLVLPSAAVPVLGLLAVTAAVALAGLRLERLAQADIVTARARVVATTALVSTDALAIAAIRATRDALGWLDDAHRGLRAGLLRQGRARAWTVGSTNLATAVTTAVMAAVVQPWLLRGMSAPLAALLVLVPIALGEVLTGLPDVLGALARAEHSRTRLDRLLSQSPAVTGAGQGDLAGGRRTSGPSAPAVSLAGVAASWDGRRETVSAVDLDLPAGRRVGLVGPTGCGKSTLLAVLARQLDPSAGRYTLDGLGIDELSLAACRAPIAIVDDDPHVFATTVRENLRLARPGCDDDAIRAAIDRAGLRSWLAGLPDGLDTMLGMGSRGVSGGERTRLALARADLSARPVLLLDEPVAHLDSPTARQVMADLAAGWQGRTVVLVSHRPEGLEAINVIYTVTAHGLTEPHRTATMAPWQLT